LKIPNQQNYKSFNSGNRSFRYLLIAITFLFTLNLSKAQENTSILCGDGLDNDGDGLIDCMDEDCVNQFRKGCQTCFEDGSSFADVVIEYSQNSSDNTHTNPQAALGLSDYISFGDLSDFQFVSLSKGGFIKLGFENNLLINSGDNGPDLWIFEVGEAIEKSQIELKPHDQNTIDQLIAAGLSDTNGDGYFEFGEISGSTSSLDIDAFVPGFSQSELIFDAVKITSLETSASIDQTTPGADIDAICALSSIILDCNDVLNGPAEIDECGECLDPADAAFNQSCADCNRTPNGLAEIDECGECLEPTNPEYNKRCLDCEGIINGTAIIDDCGACLQPEDVNFGSCLLIPNAFSPNNDGINDSFRIFPKAGLSPTVTLYQIFNRWGQWLYSRQNMDLTSNANWWNGKDNKDNIVDLGAYIYYITASFENGDKKTFKGNVTVVR